MKKFTFPMLLATALVAASCSNDEYANDGYDADAGKYLIELGAGDKAVSRAGFTEAQTTLKLHYVSTRVAKSETFPYDDAADKPGNLYMTSSATAEIDTKGGVADVSAITQTTGATGEKRYWDDIHGKNSKLALYAIAVPNMKTITKNATAFNGWDTKQKEGTATSVSNDIAWTVSTSQTLATIKDEDLAYSNNVKGDNSLVYSTSNNRFEKANVVDGKTLVFNHALSRFTINVKKGEGFGDFSETEFKVTSVKLSGFTTGGTLDVAAGTMSSTANATVETVGSQADYMDGENKLGYTYVVQVFPNTTIKDADTEMLTIVVDGNNYPITGDEIFKSLQSNNPTMDESKISKLNPGTNYNLTIIIKKTGIEIAAARLVDWDTVNGALMTPSNAINLTALMEKTAGDASKVVASDLYRSTSLTSGYTTSGNKTTLAADGRTMGTTWYWPDNSTSYYLRTISPQGTDVATSTPNTITMEGGAIDDANDFIWGAPLQETHDATPHSFTYSNGYDSYLYPAIGVTKSEIHITQFHMMSNIEVNLTTSTGEDKVALTDAKVEIMNYDNSATLALSNAAISLSGSKTETSGAITTTDHLKHTWRVIPQTTTDVTFKITAAGNVYVVNLPAETGIASWLPGKSYVYNFKLLKTAIEVTSAKLVDWETVTATDKEVTLE